MKFQNSQTTLVSDILYMDWSLNDTHNHILLLSCAFPNLHTFHNVDLSVQISCPYLHLMKLLKADLVSHHIITRI